MAVPVALPGLTAGLALAWARALGEFGATLMFAGSFQGITQTTPLAIYDQFPSDFPAALALYCEALHEAQTQADPPFDPPPDFMPNLKDAQELRVLNWRDRFRLSEPFR